MLIKNHTNVNGPQPSRKSSVLNIKVLQERELVKLMKPKAKIPFPNHILDIIASFAILTPSCILKYRFVCQVFKEVIDTDKFWFPMLYRRYPSSKEKVKSNPKFACLQMDRYIYLKLHPLKSDVKKNTKTTIEYKIAIIGEKEVGKSAIFIQLLQQKFVEKYVNKVDEVTITQLKVDGEAFFLDLLDIQDTNYYASIQDTFIKQVHGVLLVYSVTNRESFKKIQNLYDYVKRVKERDWAPMIIVANKVDDKDRVVSQEEGLDLAKFLNVGYIEVSAKNRVNIEESFAKLIRIIIRDFIIYNDLWDSLAESKPILSKKDQKCILM